MRSVPDGEGSDGYGLSAFAHPATVMLLRAQRCNLLTYSISFRLLRRFVHRNDGQGESFDGHGLAAFDHPAGHLFSVISV